MSLTQKTPEMNELEQDKQSLIFLACNFEKQKNEKHFTFGVFFHRKKKPNLDPLGTGVLKESSPCKTPKYP